MLEGPATSISKSTSWWWEHRDSPSQPWSQQCSLSSIKLCDSRELYWNYETWRTVYII